MIAKKSFSVCRRRASVVDAPSLTPDRAQILSRGTEATVRRGRQGEERLHAIASDRSKFADGIARTLVYRNSKKYILLRRKNACAANSLNFLLGRLGKELGLNNKWLCGKGTLPEDFEVTGLCEIDHWGNVLLILIGDPQVLGYERPQPVEVNGGAEILLVCLVEIAHSDLTEVTRMELIEIDSMMMLATSVTATAGCTNLEKSHERTR